MKFEPSQTEDARQLAKRQTKSNQGNKNSALLHGPERQMLIDCLNWPAFDYYRCLHKLKQGVENDSTHTLTLEAAAQLACLEPKYFSCFFRKKVGISFVTWRNTLWVSKAIELISKADCPMGHIAHAVGFHDFRTFERAFKKHTGMTPREFKKSVVASRPMKSNANFTTFAGKTTKNAAKSLWRSSKVTGNMAGGEIGPSQVQEYCFV